MKRPTPNAKAPSRMAAIGSYVLTPDIFDAIKHLKPGHGGELILADAISELMGKRPVYACDLEGEYFDTGSKIGWLKANIAMALRRKDLANDMQDVLKSLRT